MLILFIWYLHKAFLYVHCAVCTCLEMHLWKLKSCFENLKIFQNVFSECWKCHFRDPNFKTFPDLPRNLAPSALGWWFRHWLAPPKKTLLDPPLPVAGTALNVGGSPQSSGNRQIIESQSANCFRSLENINWIGRKKVKYLNQFPFNNPF